MKKKQNIGRNLEKEEEKIYGREGLGGRFEC